MARTENITEISSEIDAIIAQAMAEYQNAKGVDVFAPTAPVEETSDPVVEQIAEPEPEPIIPVNSQSTLVSETTSRFSSAIWFTNIQSKTITLAGLGGIGSYVAFLLSRLRPDEIIMYDDDIVEAANMSGQLYGRDDINNSKVSSMADMMGRYSDYYNYACMQERFTPASTPTNIMICGFDNMQARKEFYFKWKENVMSQPEESHKNCLFIDGRLAAEQFQVYCITGDNLYAMQKYEESCLFSDREADETICSYKQTTFMANMIGSIMVNLFVNFCANECDPLIPRDLPFYTEYNAETMYFKVEA